MSFRKEVKPKWMLETHYDINDKFKAFKDDFKTLTVFADYGDLEARVCALGYFEPKLGFIQRIKSKIRQLISK